MLWNRERHHIQEPTFKFLWAISMTFRFIAAAAWFAVSNTFVIECIAASTSCWRLIRIAHLGPPRSCRWPFALRLLASVTVWLRKTTVMFSRATSLRKQNVALQHQHQTMQ